MPDTTTTARPPARTPPPFHGHPASAAFDPAPDEAVSMRSSATSVRPPLPSPPSSRRRLPINAAAVAARGVTADARAMAADARALGLARHTAAALRQAAAATTAAAADRAAALDGAASALAADAAAWDGHVLAADAELRAALARAADEAGRAEAASARAAAAEATAAAARADADAAEEGAAVAAAAKALLVRLTPPEWTAARAAAAAAAREADLDGWRAAHATRGRARADAGAEVAAADAAAAAAPTKQAAARAAGAKAVALARLEMADGLPAPPRPPTPPPEAEAYFFTGEGAGGAVAAAVAAVLAAADEAEAAAVAAERGGRPAPHSSARALPARRRRPLSVRAGPLLTPPTSSATAAATTAATSLASALLASPDQPLPAHFGSRALSSALAGAPGADAAASAARAAGAALSGAAASAASAVAAPLAGLKSSIAAPADLASAGAHFGRDALARLAAGPSTFRLPTALPPLPDLPPLPRLPPLPSVSGGADLPAAAAAAWAAAAADGLGPTHAPLAAVLAGVVGVAAVAAATAGAAPEPNAPPLPETYSPDVNAAYWARRPVSVLKRALTLAREAGGWGAGLALDFATGRVAESAPVRAAEARLVLERLGPAYIKVAQAVSTRVDVLSAPYLAEIERLTDRVPVFPTTIARAAMAEAWGVAAPEDILSSVGAEPIAAASLGQVYRATLRDGGADVAVKVQRPGVAEAVSLDLLIMRWLAGGVNARSKSNTDWVALIDEWAGRFWAELDYRLEAATATAVARQLEDVKGVVIPAPFPALTSRCVLVTEFIDGVRLADSDAGDVRELCTTLLSVYLYQLLEGGILHSDPHPGNLIYEPKHGRVAIIDWGLVTDIPPNISLNLLSYITHLSTEDWEGVARDLVGLGFVKEGAPDPVEAGIAKPLGAVLRQLSQGGGAKGVDVAAVTAELEDLTTRYPNLQIPAYFALILRAFSTIEGIALKVDPSYSIVSECFPYLARRLLTDDHPRAVASLRELLYGDGRGGRVNVKRLMRLGAGFAAYTTDGVTTAGGSGGGSTTTTTALAVAAKTPAEPQSLVDPAALDLAATALAKPGPVQDVLVEEAAAVAGALRRAGAARLAAAVSGPVGGVPASLSEEDEAALAMLGDLAAAGREAAAAAYATARANGRTAGPLVLPRDPVAAARTLARTLEDVRPYARSLGTGAVRTLARVIARSGD